MTNSERPIYHVLPNETSGWAVKKDGGKRASRNFSTKKEAEQWGREVSRNQGAEFIIHGKDGEIQRTASHSNDPVPSINNESSKVAIEENNL